jgi:hypothetical protein
MNDNNMVHLSRSILEKIQWHGEEGCEPYCKICNEQCGHGHKEDCPIGIALKPKDVIIEEKVIPQNEMEYKGKIYRTIQNSIHLFPFVQ